MGKYRVWGSVFYPAAEDIGGISVVIKKTFSDLHDALIAVGMTQTTDTGQIVDFESGVNVITTKNVTTHGFRVYELNDSFHTNSPIFIKVEYQSIFRTNSSKGVAHMPMFTLQIGSGSNGSGGLVNASLGCASIQMDYIGLKYPELYNEGTFSSYVYLDDGVFWMAIGCGAIKTRETASLSVLPNYPGAGSPIACFAISRACDEAGSIILNKAALISTARLSAPLSISDYVGFFQYAPDCHFLDLSRGQWFRSARPLARPISDMQLTFNGSTPLSRLYGYFGDGKLTQLSGLASVPAGQISDGDVFQATLEGIKERIYTVPNRGIKGFQDITHPTDDRNYQSSPAFDTPVFSWGGTEV